ncbi:hypothetical protein V5P93_000229 [Actinokineospora auranticolor]|uniref:Uncharacterized protein n=1 Tax=Actinokineospora auranticolor TaxID=155976 RepID=A0A2S6GL15_9PSEU|nr:hypothetical protein [Actinokineospora auranticolor]PPK65880.1 hypothetical protein CLV40_112143 [Actinokineospora auranticolor]
MTQDYSGGNFNPQPPQYPQQPPAYPQTGGFPAPPPPGQYPVGAVGPRSRPGSATSAAVLAFVQASITGILTLLIAISAFDGKSDGIAVAVLIVLVQFAGVGLLAVGGAQVLKGTGRGLLIGGNIVEIVIGLVYLAIFSIIPTFNFDLFEQVKAVAIIGALLLTAIPAISLAQAAGSNTSAWLRPSY